MSLFAWYGVAGHSNHAIMSKYESLSSEIRDPGCLPRNVVEAEQIQKWWTFACSSIGPYAEYSVCASRDLRHAIATNIKSWDVRVKVVIMQRCRFGVVKHPRVI